MEVVDARLREHDSYGTTQMTEGQKRSDSNQERLWRWGCGCLGTVTCLGLLLILLALAGVLLFGLLFTAPPLEFMSQFNDFLENELSWVVIILFIMALAVGGFFGSFAGKLIAKARRNVEEGS